MSEQDEERAFREIFRRAHAGHAGCRADEWLMEPCSQPEGGEVDRPVVWSRRNGPWRRADVLWVGAAPGNAGGKGAGTMGAHATRIPFGGDIAGANLDLLLETAGLDRNSTYIVAALNQLPDRGGGEPSVAELRRPVGDYATSVHLLRDTLLAVHPRLVVALGNVALRTTVAASRLGAKSRLTLPGLKRLTAVGLTRGETTDWPPAFAPDEDFLYAWSRGGGRASLPQLLWLLHPSAQNMSPYAGVGTVFHGRMVETRDALVGALDAVPDLRSPGQRGAGGVYALPEWREAIGPRHAALIGLWHEKGL